MKFFIPFLTFVSIAFATNQSSKANQSCSSETLSKYTFYLEHYPSALFSKGDAQKGEIEIVLDENKILDIQKKSNRVVGLVAEDKYWLWINDAVKFPNGTYGVYGRMLWRSSLSGTPGVAVMPILPNGKIALIRTYRHATRSWEYELPRGGINTDESIEDAAAREVKEETGMVIDHLYFLGNVTPDSGMINSIIPVFLAIVKAKEIASPEDSEAIASVDAFSLDDLKQGFIDGYLSAEVNGEMQKIPLRDSFLTFALFQAQIRHLLSQ